MKLMLENLSKIFPGRRVFENITESIEGKGTLVITGPNGSGKTTLLNVICSVLPASSGKVIFEHQSQSYSGAELLPHIGLVSPDLYLYDELTANENLIFFAKISGIENIDYNERLTRFGLEGRGDDLVRSFSSGMKQRLKYILALLRQPPLLVLDEPSANLDDTGKQVVREIISGHEGITIIATNEKDELSYATRTIELAK